MQSPMPCTAVGRVDLNKYLMRKINDNIRQLTKELRVEGGRKKQTNKQTLINTSSKKFPNFPISNPNI